MVLQKKAEKAMAPHYSTIAWKIPWMEEPGRLQYMGSLSRTRLSDFTFTFHFHALEKEMATHSSVLAWRIPGTGEPGGLLSMGSHRVGHDWSDAAAAAAAAEGKKWRKGIGVSCRKRRVVLFPLTKMLICQREKNTSHTELHVLLLIKLQIFANIICFS